MSQNVKMESTENSLTLKDYLKARLESLKAGLTDPHSTWKYESEQQIKARIGEIENILSVLDTCPAVMGVEKSLFVEMLREMEFYRGEIASGKKTATPDFAVRICESVVAKAAGYQNRVSWVREINTSG